MKILAIDSGTTTTRVWAVEDGRISDHERALGGARDVAQGRDQDWLRGHVRGLAQRVADRAGGWDAFDAAVAFGMVTSEHGLAEVAHLPAPAAPADLAAALMPLPAGDVLPIPLLLVPGVLCENRADAARADFMRGEETEVAGLLAEPGMIGPLLFVSPGSHSKFIAVDAAGRISWSVTTLAGELLWTLSQETILAGLVTADLDEVDLQAVDRGDEAARDQGLTRALYVTRLLHRLEEMPAASCAAFALGAVAADDLQALDSARRHGVDVPGDVVLGGEGALVTVYEHLLSRAAWASQVRRRPGLLGPLGAWSLFAMAHSAGGGGPAAPDATGAPSRQSADR
ncbi:MAG TPA: 2-dehydro-3-deoxygalactonokinase [Egibacteraceae bacterium]|nr:2-dehydro-3-deoxygalactonokinase [Egibacteraceae bacterium]